jgi:hypothetical protein
LFRADPARGRAELVRVLERNDGCVLRAAHELAIGRRHLYKMLYREKLWSEVDAMRLAARRAKREPPSWMERTRAALLRR